MGAVTESDATQVWLDTVHSLGGAQSRIELQLVLHVDPLHPNGAQSLLVPSGETSVWWSLSSHDAAVFGTQACRPVSHAKLELHCASLSHAVPHEAPLQV